MQYNALEIHSCCFVYQKSIPILCCVVFHGMDILQFI